MEKIKKISILEIIFLCLGFWALVLFNNLYWHLKLSGIIGYLFIIIYIVVCLLLFHRNDFSDLLGLSTKGINGKIIVKAILSGFIVGLLSNICMRLLLPKSVSPFIDSNLIYFFLASLILAPIIEELMFRGYIQGIIQKIIVKNNFYIPIIISAGLFAVSHFSFIFKMSVLQFIVSLFFIFVVGCVCGFFRAKYNSIVPSILAHASSNIGAFMSTIIFVLLLPNSYKMNNTYYMDKPTYNFDLNNDEEWIRSYSEYCDFGVQPTPEARKHKVKGFVPVKFTIDTCGNITNVHIDSLNNLEYKHLGYGCEEEAIRFVKEIPKNKPKIINGSKVEKEMELNIYF